MNDLERMISEVIESEDLPTPPKMEIPVEIQTPVFAPQSLSQPMFEDEEMLGLCAEVLTNMRNDRKQLDSLISNFVEMVFNEGDSTTSSKEALVSLVANKTAMSDKQMKIVDVMAKFKLKEVAESPKSVTAKQENHYHFGGNRRSFLEQIDKNRIQSEKKKKEKKDE